MEIEKILNQYKFSPEIDSQDFDKVKSWLVNYRKTKRDYFIPSFQIQDPANTSHRIMDLLGGVPFTSSDYPWPKTDGVGVDMQPIIQIDLSRASQNIGDDLGSELLQLWGRVDANRNSSLDGGTGKSLLYLRTIPRSELLDSLMIEPPSYQPWRRHDCNQNAEDVQVLFPDGSIEMKSGSIIEWKKAGGMYATPACVEMDINDNYRLYEQVFDDLLSEITSPRVSPSIYLGGHGGQAGGYEDPTGNGSLLIRLNDESSFHIGVTYYRTRKNKLVFNPIFRYYA
jgi:hypothetical protein